MRIKLLDPLANRRRITLLAKRAKDHQEDSRRIVESNRLLGEWLLTETAEVRARWTTFYLEHVADATLHVHRG